MVDEGTKSFCFGEWDRIGLRDDRSVCAVRGWQGVM